MYTSFVRDLGKRYFLTFRRNQKEALKSGRKQVENLYRPYLVNDVCLEWGYGIGLSDWAGLVPNGAKLSLEKLNEYRKFSYAVNHVTL